MRFSFRWPSDTLNSIHAKRTLHIAYKLALPLISYFSDWKDHYLAIQIRNLKVILNSLFYSTYIPLGTKSCHSSPKYPLTFIPATLALIQLLNFYFKSLIMILLNPILASFNLFCSSFPE